MSSWVKILAVAGRRASAESCGRGWLLACPVECRGWFSVRDSASGLAGRLAREVLGPCGWMMAIVTWEAWLGVVAELLD